MTTAHHTLMVMGVLAIATLVTLVVKPDFTDHIKAFSPFATTPIVPVAMSAPAAPEQLDTHSKSAQTPDEISPAKDSHIDHLGMNAGKPRQAVNPREQQWVTTWLAKRYRVASDATNMLVSAAYQTAKDTKLDPLLILSVMAIESGFNPFAESAVGAQGLMQVMSKIHHDKFQPLGGLKVALNPVANIKVGSLILKEYVNRGGSVEAGLKMYVGAAAFDNDAGYGSKVLAEYRRLQDVARGKNVPLVTAPVVIAPKLRPAEPAVEKPPQMIEAYHSPDAAAKNKAEDNEQIAAL
ncbi:MAG: lytic transglycosylase domain-containing protein [Herminiimonas sp.]|nr:lytic transglycosylase domain-containing protein [Herminiimonas sp.]